MEVNYSFDNCFICNKKFNIGDSVRIIKNRNNVHDLAHTSCASKYIANKILSQFGNNSIKELKLNKKESLTNKYSKNTLWRYITLEKYLYMLSNSCLVFNNVTKLDDKYECSHGIISNKSKWDSLYLRYFVLSIITASDNTWHYIDRQKLDKQAKTLLEQISAYDYNHVFVNCWHNNVYESEAMWKIYSKFNKNILAVQTNFENFTSVLGDKIIVEPIEYIDYSKKFVGINEAYLYKRVQFEYEKEFRAILFNYEKRGCKSCEIKVDLTKLINKIIISPYSSDYFLKVIEDVTKKYQYKFLICDSEMSKEPF